MNSEKIHNRKINSKKIEAPEEIFATIGDDPGAVNLQWDSVTGAAGYIVQRSGINGLGSWQYVDIVNESRCAVEGLSKNRKYFFRVAAISRSGRSDWSREISKKVN